MIRRWAREQLYPNWAISTIPMALVIAAVLVSAGGEIGLALTAVWVQMIVYLIHEFEEHVIPGGFKDYINHRVFAPMLERKLPPGRALPTGDFPLTDRSVFWINIVFIWILFPLAAMAAGRIDIRFGLLLPWFGIVNAITHIVVAIAKRGYNPGLVVSLVLNIPTGIWTLAVLSDAGAGTGAQLTFLGLAILFHLGLVAWIASRMLGVLRD